MPTPSSTKWLRTREVTDSDRWSESEQILFLNLVKKYGRKYEDI